MQTTPWIRAWRDYLGDPKMLALSLAEEGSWWRLLLLTPNDGILPGSPAQYAPLLRLSPTEAETFFERCVSLGLISRVGARFKVTKWSERQFFSDYSTPRVQRFRKKKRETFPKRYGETVVKRTRPEETRREEILGTESLNHPPPVQEISGLQEGVSRRSPRPRSNGFHPPSVPEVKKWVAERHPEWNEARIFDAVKFCGYYDSVGWVVGKKRMVNWHAAAVGWARREEERKLDL